MDKYRCSGQSIQSFSYRKMNRRIRQAIVSTQKMCEHRKDIPSSTLIYKQHRQPIWRLKYYSAYTDDRYKWPKSRRIVNLLSDPYRKLYQNPIADGSYLFSLPISSELRTRPKLSQRDRRPLKSSSSYLVRYNPPRLVVPPAPIRRYQVTPLRSLTQDYSYLYDTRSGRSNENSDLGLKSRLLSRISAYSFPLIDETEERSHLESRRLAEKLYSTYANKTLEEETAKEYKIRNGLASQGFEYKYIQPTRANCIQSTRIAIMSLGNSIRRRINKYSPPGVPKYLKSKVGRWTKPFFPNEPRTFSSRTTTNLRETNLDHINTTKYVPKYSSRVFDFDKTSNYSSRNSALTDMHRKISESSHRTISAGSAYRRCATRSEILPVTDDISLRLRLNMRLSSSGMSHLYPNENLTQSSLPTTVSNERKSRLRAILDEEDELLSSMARSSKYSRKHEYSSKSHTSTRKMWTPVSSTRNILKPPQLPRKKIDYEHLYPSSPPRSTVQSFTLRPLPGSNLKLGISRLAQQISSKFDDDLDLDEDLPRVLTSVNNYSQLYEPHPEHLHTSELGQRLKLSLRSSTSKIASLYASHPVRTSSLLPIQRKKTQNPYSSRIPDKYLPDAYVPRPGILTASRVRPNLHGLP